MLNVRFQSLTVRPEITHVLHHLIQSGDSSSSKIRVRVRVTLLILEHLSHSSNIRFRIRVRMIKIRIRNQSASAGAPQWGARASASVFGFQDSQHTNNTADHSDSS